MSYTYLQEQEGESLEVCFSDTPQFALWKLNPIAERSYSNDNETECCQSSQFGMMCKPLTESLGKAKSISSVEDFHVKTSVSLAMVQGLMVNDQVCGDTWQESLVKFDLNLLSWKTHQCLWDEDLAPSSLILPKWGMMRNGVLWERITSPLRINETESGYWPTPTCADATMGAILNNNTNLITLKSGKLRKISNQGVSGSIGLARTVAIWATPCARDWKGKLGPSANQRNSSLPTMVGEDVKTVGKLNPTWVEWLMGWCLGWTDLKPLEMDKFQQWQQWHGKFSQNNK